MSASIQGIVIHLTCNECGYDVPVPVGFTRTVLEVGGSATYAVEAKPVLHSCPRPEADR